LKFILGLLKSLANFSIDTFGEISTILTLKAFDKNSNIVSHIFFIDLCIPVLGSSSFLAYLPNSSTIVSSICSSNV